MTRTERAVHASPAARGLTVMVEGRCQNMRSLQRGSPIMEGGDTTISSPGRSSKQPLPGTGLHYPLHGRQACPEVIAFDQGVGQICPRQRLFSCRFLPKRGQICYIPAFLNRGTGLQNMNKSHLARPCTGQENAWGVLHGTPTENTRVYNT